MWFFLCVTTIQFPPAYAKHANPVTWSPQCANTALLRKIRTYQQTYKWSSEGLHWQRLEKQLTAAPVVIFLFHLDSNLRGLMPMSIPRSNRNSKCCLMRRLHRGWCIPNSHGSSKDKLPELPCPPRSCFTAEEKKSEYVSSVRDTQLYLFRFVIKDYLPAFFPFSFACLILCSP